MYRHALNPEIQDELASHGATLSFEDYIQLSVTLDKAVRECPYQRDHPVAMPTARLLLEEPMRLGCSPLTTAEAPPHSTWALPVLKGIRARSLNLPHMPVMSRRLSEGRYICFYGSVPDSMYHTGGYYLWGGTVSH